MPTVGNTYYNLIDMYRSKSPDGSIEADIVEILSELTPVMRDGVTLECNDGTKHIHTVRSALPAVTWGRLYKGIPASKSGRTQVTDTTGFIEGISEIDKRLLDLAGDKAAAVRLSEARGFLQSIAHEAEQTFFYGDVISAPDEFKGLAARMNTLGDQVIDGGGSGSDNTSIYFVTHSEDYTSILHPANLPAGVQREDKGEQRVLDGSGNAYFAMEELFRLHMGVSVKDPRGNARICNIDVSEVADGNVDLYGLMRKAYYRLQVRRSGKYVLADGSANPNAARTGRTCLYMNRDILEALDALATNAGSSDSFVRLRPMELEGEEVMSYRGMPIRETDSLLNTEEAVA